MQLAFRSWDDVVRFALREYLREGVLQHLERHVNFFYESERRYLVLVLPVRTCWAQVAWLKAIARSANDQMDKMDSDSWPVGVTQDIMRQYEFQEAYFRANGLSWVHGLPSVWPMISRYGQ